MYVRLKNHATDTDMSSSKNHAAQVAKDATTVQGNTVPTRPYIKWGDLPLELHIKDKTPKNRAEKVNSRVMESMTTSGEPLSLKKNAVGPRDAIVAQDKEGFPSLNSSKPALSSNSTHAIPPSMSKTSWQPTKITCPLDHIFGKKSPITKPSTGKTIMSKRDGRNDERSVASVGDDTLDKPHSSTLAKSTAAINNIVANFREEFPSLPSAKLAYVSGSAQNSGVNALSAPWKPKKIACPLDHILGKKQTTAKPPSSKQSLEASDRDCSISSPSRTCKSPFTSEEVKTTSGTEIIVDDPQETSAIFPASSIKKVVFRKKKAAAANTKSQQTGSVIAETPSDKSPSISDSSPSSTAKECSPSEPVFFELKTSKDEDFTIINKQTVLPEVVTDKDLSDHKLSSEGLASGISPSRVSHTSLPVEFTVPSYSPSKHKLSRKKLEKEQKTLRKIAQQAKRNAKLEQEKADREQRKQETKLAAEKAVIEAAEKQKPQAEDRRAQQEILLEIQHVLEFHQQEILEAKELRQLKNILAEVESYLNRHGMSLYSVSLSEIQEQDEEFYRDLLSQDDKGELRSEVENHCKSLDVLNNPTIAQDGSDPMDFIWSRSEEEVEPEYPRPDVLSTRTISQTGCDPMAWISNRNPADLDDDYPRPVTNVLPSSQNNQKKEEFPALVNTCTTLVAHSGNLGKKLTAQDSKQQSGIPAVISPDYTVIISLIIKIGMLLNQENTIAIHPSSELDSPVSVNHTGLKLKTTSKSRPTKDEEMQHLKKEMLHSNGMQDNEFLEPEIPRLGSSKVLIPYEAPFAATQQKVAALNSENCLEIIPIADNTATTVTTISDTCKTDIKDEDFSKPAIVHNITHTKAFDAVGDDQILETCVEKALLRNASDSSSASMTTNLTTFTGTSENLPTTTPNLAETVFSKKESRDTSLPSTEMTAIPTNLLTQLLSTLQRMETQNTALEAKFDAMKVKFNTLECKMDELTAETINAPSQQSTRQHRRSSAY